MAKIIELIKLDIDISKLLNATASTQQKMEALKQTIAGLSKEQREGIKAIEAQSKELKTLQDAGQGAGAKAKELAAQMGASQSKVNELSVTLVEQRNNLKSLAAEYNSQNRLVEAYSQKTLQGRGAIEQTDGSIKQLSAALRNNRDIYADLSKEERENEAIGGRLLNIIQAQDKEYKELTKSIGQAQANVGNYSEAFKGITNNIRLFGISVGDMRSKLEQYKGGLQQYIASVKGSAESTSIFSGVLKVFKIALAGTGIGLIVVALGSLVAYLTSTQEGINIVNKVLVPLKAVFSSLFGVIQNFGKILFEAFSNPKQLILDFLDLLKNQLVNRVKAYAVIFSGLKDIISGNFSEGFKAVRDGAIQAVTGVENLVDKTKAKFEEFGNTVSKAIDKGARVAEINRLLTSTAPEFVKRMKELELLFKEQNQISDDTTRTAEERAAAALKGIEYVKEQNRLSEARNKLEVEAIKIQQSYNDTSDADRLALAEKENELIDRQTANVEKVTTLQNKLNSIRAAEAAAIEADSKKRAEESIKNAEKELNAYNEANKSRLEQGQLLNDTILSQEIARIDAVAAYNKAAIENTLADEQYKSDKIAEIEATAAEQKKALEAQRKEQEKEAAAIDLQNDYELKLQNAQGEFEARQIQLEARREQELAEAEKTGADKGKIEQKYAKLSADIEKEKEKMKMQIRDAAFSAAIALFGRESTIGKAAAIAQATINTWVAASNALRYTLLPAPFPQIAAAAAIATGLAQVAQITGVQIPKFEEGGLMSIGGNRHSGGGTKFYGEDGTRFEAERGELIGVMNRPAASAFMKFNNIYRDKPHRNNFFAGGGLVNRSVVSVANPVSLSNKSIDIDYEYLASLISQGVSQANEKLPPQNLVFSEFDNAQAKYRNINYD